MRKPRLSLSIRTTAAALIMAAGVVHASCPDSLPVFTAVENHFEWGAYDSLVPEAESLLAAPPQGANPRCLCRLSLYLGVSYFAAGRISDARGAFERVMACDPAADLDRRYVSDEIYDFYALTVKDYRRQVAQRDSLAKTEALRAATATAAAEQRRLAREHSRSRVLASVAYGVAFVLAGSGAGVVLGTRDTYDEFLAAARDGDRRIYDRRREDLGYANGSVIACGVGSVAAVVIGGFLTARARGKRPAVSGVWIHTQGAGVGLTLEF